MAKPTIRTSVASSIPVVLRTSSRMASITRRTSSADPPRSAWMKLACFLETSADPIRIPFMPQASISRPAESPGGLVNTEPALAPPG